MSKLRQILKNNYFEINALISIIIFGIIFSIFLPFQMAPDEEVHMYGAYSVSDRMMGIEPFSVNGTTNMRNDDRLDGYLMNGYTHENLHIYWDKLKEGVSDETIVDSGHPAPNSLPYSYFFASLGITIGRLLHLGAMKVFFLGRIFNLIFFAVTIFFSIKIIPKGKSILFALSLMPMSVELAASLSYDAFLIPLMFLITALTVKIITDGTLNKKEFILLIAVSLLISPMKGGAYLPIIVIPYFYLLWKNRKKIIKDDKIRHIIYICIIGLIIIASLLVFLYFRMKPDENYHEVLDLQGYSIPYIAKHPLHASKVFFNTVITSSGWYFDTFCGMLLGRLEIAVNQILRLFYVIILFLASIKRDYEEDFIFIRGRLFFLCMAVLSILFIFFGMMIGWTDINSDVIQGVQGRYFIPVAFYIIILFWSENIKATKKIDIILMCMSDISLLLTMVSMVMCLR